MPKVNHSIVRLLLPLVLVLMAGTARAYAVDGYVTYWDKRLQRSNNGGSRVKQSTFQTNQPISGIQVFLLDQDGSCIDLDPNCLETDDDYLGDAYTDANGYYRVPVVIATQQLYLYTGYQDYYGNFMRLQTMTWPIVVQRPAVAVSSAFRLDLSLTCWDDTQNLTRGLCDNQTDVDSFFQQTEALSNAAASMMQIRATGMLDLTTPPGTNSILLFWPDGPNNECSGAVAGRVFEDGIFCVTSAFDTHVIGHEMGHIIHERLMGITNAQLLTGGGCTGGDFWEQEQVNEKCVTAEAFADFTSGAAHWKQDSDFPRFRGRRMEGDYNGSSGSKCVSMATSPHRRIGNAVRFFWDFYDQNHLGIDDATGDDEASTWATIAGIWTVFAPGTGNRQNRESGGNGRNIEDFVYHAANTANPWYWVAYERDHNCVGGQAD